MELPLAKTTPFSTCRTKEAFRIFGYPDSSAGRAHVGEQVLTGWAIRANLRYHKCSKGTSNVCDDINSD